MRRKATRLLTLVVALALMAGACTSSEGSDDSTAAPTTGATDVTDSVGDPLDGNDGRYEVTDCWIEPPEGPPVECGHLVVPLDRSDPDGAEIRLAVVRLVHPDGASEPDPIVYLAGGPGERIVQVVLGRPGVLEGFAELHASGRDVIVFDQRGVGFSEPVLPCDLGGAYAEALSRTEGGAPMSARDAGEQVAAAFARCGDELAGSVDLSHFNTAESAADVAALRRALELDEVNLWGVSYGSRLAQEVMRSHPGGVRTVTIDAVVPPDLELVDYVEAADRGFRQLVDGCAADGDCNAAFPDLGRVLVDTIESLDADPPVLTTANPATGGTVDVPLTGAVFTQLLYLAMYDTSTIPQLPAVIYAASAGDYTNVTDALPGLFALDQIQDFGMAASVRCHEDRVALPSVDEYDQLTSAYPHLAGLIDLHIVFRPLALLCQEWPAGVAEPGLREPVTSDIPTFALTGQYDPVLDPAWGERAVSSMSVGRTVEYPGIGHGSVGTDPCPTRMFVAFVDDPDSPLDDSCVAEMGVTFATPGAVDPGGPVVMEEFADADQGIAGLAPQGWRLLEPGVWTRSDPQLDPTFLIQKAVPPDRVDVTVEGFLAEIGGTDAGEAIDAFALGDRNWELFSPEADLGALLATTTDGEPALVVLLAADPAQLDGLTESVFRPALGALEVPEP